MSVLIKYGSFNKHLNVEEEQKYNSTDYNYLWNKVEQPQEIINSEA